MWCIFDEDDGVIACAETQEEAQAAAEFLDEGYFVAKVNKIQGHFTYFQASRYAGEEQVKVREFKTVFYREPGRVEYPRAIHSFGRTEEEARNGLRDLPGGNS